MELHLKINDVVGMDGQKRHILRVDSESLIQALMEHPGWMEQNLVRQFLLKHPRLLNEVIDDPELRNTIYMNEKIRREEKSNRRQRHNQSATDRQRRREQHQASIATRRAQDFYRDILGVETDLTTTDLTD